MALGLVEVRNLARVPWFDRLRQFSSEMLFAAAWASQLVQARWMLAGAVPRKNQAFPFHNLVGTVFAVDVRSLMARMRH